MSKYWYKSESILSSWWSKLFQMMQLQAAWAMSVFASQDEEAQVELGAQGAIRLLVAILAHDTIVVERAPSKPNSNNSIHSIVQTNISHMRSKPGSQSSQHLGYIDETSDILMDLPPGPQLALKPGAVLAHITSSAKNSPANMFHGAVLTHMKSAAQPLASPENVFPGTRMTASLRQTTLREKVDPETKLGLKVQAAHALWKLAVNNIKNCKLITDTCALLCFAKLIETGDGDLKYNSIMAVMEIAAAAERDPELRRSAFKTNSPSAKAVVQRLLIALRDENEEPDLQVSLNSYFFITIYILQELQSSPGEGAMFASEFYEIHTIGSRNEQINMPNRTLDLMVPKIN